MDKKVYQAFMKHLDQEQKDESLLLILGLLDQGANIREVYENYIIPALANYYCDSEIEEICIWREHARTSIIRTILEATYQYLIKQKGPSIGKTILVACPQEEYHEIGAIIATNYFSLAGFDAKYIGANTPSEQIISAVRIMKPDFLALSITNYYNVVVTKKLIDTLKENYPELKIVLGGQATSNEKTCRQLQYDYLLNSYQDIIDLREGLK